MSERLRYLFGRHLQGNLESAEKKELMGLVLEPTLQADVQTLVKEAWEITGDAQDIDDDASEILLRKVFHPAVDHGLPQQDTRIRKMNWRRWVAAASVILLLGTGAYLLFNDKPGKKNEVAKTPDKKFKQDVQPGGYKARLTLADGSTIVLDSAGTGQLVTQGKTVVVKKDGQLVYDVQGNENEMLYNTLSTSNGETYVTVLADGSKVWLNAASSIKFPVAFVGNQRKVEITGEAYFEISKDPAKPFIVSSGGMDVQVLGTHFNVNSYTNEPNINVTLLEGSVKVKKDNVSSLLKPGQQAQVGRGIHILNDVDVAVVVAWKNGLTQFKSTDIKSIMRQVERWYNVEVVYEGNIIARKFSGGVSRDAKLSELLRILEASDIRFRLEGKQLIVMP